MKDFSFRLLSHAITSVVAVLVICSCAPKPQLVDNAKLKKVGSSEASDDIERCMNEAKVRIDGVEKTVEKETGARTTGALVSSATSGVTSGATTVGGVNVSGSFADGVSNSISGLMTDQSDNPKYRKLVNACLRRKDYRVTEWN